MTETPKAFEPRVLIWDSVVRLFHWLFAIGFASAYTIAQFSDDDSATFPYHMMVGLTLAFMVVLRLVWAVVGSRWARFTGLALNPLALASYMATTLEKNAKDYIGHNPATSFTMLAMFVLTLALAFTGYQTAQGSEAFEDVHPVLANLFLALVAAHIAGVVVHRLVRKHNIAASMLHGRKPGATSDGIAHHHVLAGGAFLVLTGLFAAGLVSAYSPVNLSTRWPLIGQEIRLGKGEERRELRTDRDHREDRRDRRRGRSDDD